jgi:hypothetical protein
MVTVARRFNLTNRTFSASIPLTRQPPPTVAKQTLIATSRANSPKPTVAPNNHIAGITSRSALSPTDPQNGRRPPSIGDNRRAIISTVSVVRELRKAGPPYGIREDVMVAEWFRGVREFDSQRAKDTQQLRDAVKADSVSGPQSLEVKNGGRRYGIPGLTIERMSQLLEAGAIVFPSTFVSQMPSGRVGDLVRRTLADPRAYAAMSTKDQFLVCAYLLSETRAAPTIIAANLAALAKQYVDLGGDPRVLADTPEQFYILTQLGERGEYTGGQRPSSNKFENGVNATNHAGYNAILNYPVIAAILRNEVPPSFDGFFVKPRETIESH